MGFNELENRIDDEFLTGDEAKVREMLGGMKRVEAPKDFGFKVQARIASSKPEDFRAKSRLPVLGYALPLVLVLVVTSAFIINGLYSVNETSVPAVAGSQATQPPLDPGPAVPANEVAVRVTAEDLRANSNSVDSFAPDANSLAVNPPRPGIEKRAANSKSSGGGSFDTTQGGPAPFFKPPGAKSNASGKPGDLVARGQIEIRGILEIAGIRADFADLGWKVKSVDSNSVAERAGVKAGDLIEAINGLPVTDGTQFSGSFTGKNLKVKRDGITLEINLR